MKFFRTISIALLLLFSTANYAQKAYELKFEIKGLSDGELFLSNYYGSGQYYKDTAFVENGKFTFDGTTPLDQGLYAVVKDNRRVLDLIVDNQTIKMTSDTANVIFNMKIDNSPENKLFYEYMTFLGHRQKEVIELRATLDSNSTKKEKQEVEDKIDLIDQKVKDYRKDFFAKHKNSFTVKFLSAMEYPVIPEAPKEFKNDSTFAYRYTKQHIFDAIDFTDERLLNSPAYHEKIAYYINELTMQIPDSIIVATDYLLEKASANPKLFKYTLGFITNKYERSEYVGMDAVFVHNARKYYLTDKVDWIGEVQLKKIKERADALEPLLIGKKAPNIVVKDTAQERFIQLYDVDAKYTILYIWSPDCGHCKISTPKLKEVYDKYKSKGVKVFAVNNDFENEHWLKYIKKHNLDWINGSDGGDFTSNFRDLYDVYSTPQTYLLDKDKKILIKKVEIEAIDKMLEKYFQKEESKNGK